MKSGHDFAAAAGQYDSHFNLPSNRYSPSGLRFRFNASRRWFAPIALGLAAMALGLGRATPAQAQGQNVAALFPDPARVAADYPDEVQRYVALNLLWDVSHATVPGATAQRSAYYQAAEAIRTKYLVMGTKASTDFDERNEKLSLDPNFRRAVLEKYGLVNLPTQAPHTATGPAPRARTGEPSDAEIQLAFLKASPAIVITILLMVPLARRSVRKASRYSAVAPAVPGKFANLPVLPETLRVISLPQSEYSVEVSHGLAFDKETTLQTHVHTATTQGQIYTVGNEVYSTPSQTTTSVSTTQKDLVWIRTPDGRETSWTFTGGRFQVRPGQALSAVTASAGGAGTTGFLMAYNHNTGQFDQYGTGDGGVRGGSGWFLCSLLGSVGFGLAIAIILSIQAPDASENAPSDVIIRYLAMWIEGGIVAAIVALFLVSRAKSKLAAQRNARFHNHYVPAFRQFFEQATPQLKQHFGIDRTA